jgi:ribosomal protein S18 acetylase RimI-like enzyme
MEYTYTHVDRTDRNLPAQALKYRDLRLAALKQSPTSFSSTYETEAAFSDSIWLSRLSEPSKETFICVTSSAAPNVQEEWVAQVTLLGPISASAYTLPDEAGQPPVLPDDEEEKWQMLSLYTLPTHRGKGLGKKLCQEAFKFLTAIQSNPPKVRVRIMVKPENHITLGLYPSLGFKDAGKCTLEEALRANGDAAMLPSGELGEKYTRRSGIIMDLALDRS